MNPTSGRSDGRHRAVTLSDEEARRRGTRKTVLERKAPPTFDVLIEIQDRDRLAIHQERGEVVDALLRGYTPQPEVRQRTASGGSISCKKPIRRRSGARCKPTAHAAREDDPLRRHGEAEGDRQPLMIFPYGVSRNKIERAIQNLRVNASIARKWDDADVVVTLKTLERKERNGSKRSPPRTCRSTRSKRTRRRRSSRRSRTSSTCPRSMSKKSRCAKLRRPSTRCCSTAGRRALPADVVRAPPAAPARRTAPPAVAQHRFGTKPARAHLQVGVVQGPIARPVGALAPDAVVVRTRRVAGLFTVPVPPDTMVARLNSVIFSIPDAVDDNIKQALYNFLSRQKLQG